MLRIVALSSSENGLLGKILDEIVVDKRTSVGRPRWSWLLVAVTKRERESERERKNGNEYAGINNTLLTRYEINVVNELE